MNKNIIFCADGTWNSPDQDDNRDGQPDYTNVWRLYGDLAGAEDTLSPPLKDEYQKTLTADGGVVQVARYIHGVGDSDNWLLKILGGVFGAGILCHIVRGYLFVSRHYRPGDRIYLTGFSRGAYTARALAGMIGKCGLLDAGKVDFDDEQNACRLGVAAWLRYRQNSGASVPLINRLLAQLPRLFHRDLDPDLLLADVPIEAVAVWETVGALGIPRYQNAKRLDVYQFADTRLGERVRYGRQAIAIDEERVDFTPTCWHARDGIVQVLFAGIHSDVGGGYPAGGDGNGLSNISYRWLRDELRTLGAQVNSVARAEDPLGGIHCEWGGGKPWITSPRTLGEPVSPGMMIHRAAVTRLQSSAPSPVMQPGGGWQNQLYRPQALRAFTAPDWRLPPDTVIAE
ncbi:DUF2235 domain-containing protein [Pluralibacter gergoviae]|uniref:DUF2235 domain-containing protein n=1 Tax=Pluralibacter gergoviae TaxID=61647 RepID=A0AAW8HJE0_PLUGE|nr:DUF2235 domain-containing protein [Pluralibacter gergoviae]AVR04161.1 DUF2235 domain-containing protein [Pluralibacter gergoviae]MDQ2307556.1 DUF2235 domain-containing protein [Pluralibacter gergoviae]SUB71611.1 Uncharacterized conserved protein [Pluralibacter gergoviae]